MSHGADPERERDHAGGHARPAPRDQPEGHAHADGEDQQNDERQPDDRRVEAGVVDAVADQGKRGALQRGPELAMDDVPDGRVPGQQSQQERHDAQSR